jgi:hypothetical protein
MLSDGVFANQLKNLSVGWDRTEELRYSISCLTLLTGQQGSKEMGWLPVRLMQYEAKRIKRRTGENGECPAAEDSDLRSMSEREAAIQTVLVQCTSEYYMFRLTPSDSYSLQHTKTKHRTKNRCFDVALLTELFYRST